ncbi:hypothetical protein COLO4_25234 [Corchorus olitorius]|uniref:Uncharacterized protein n=1 Tax=Corchorus olitorius TaxID=93759 RepID=A0A1R3I3X0_9ROSI|nr:hypothetical protein COLO4_25234 [Corchorus olitorius]
MFLSSGNPCLDLFFHVVPDTPPESLTQRLQLAWDHNPLTTLKLVSDVFTAFLKADVESLTSAIRFQTMGKVAVCRYLQCKRMVDDLLKKGCSGDVSCAPELQMDGMLKAEQMIRRLFVFSDMEFDQASTSRLWETDYQVIVSKFTAEGYGESIPQIVFWNLRDSKATPVPGNQNGVAFGWWVFKEFDQHVLGSRWRYKP